MRSRIVSRREPATPAETRRRHCDDARPHAQGGGAREGRSSRARAGVGAKRRSSREGRGAFSEARGCRIRPPSYAARRARGRARGAVVETRRGVGGDGEAGDPARAGVRRALRCVSDQGPPAIPSLASSARSRTRLKTASLTSSLSPRSPRPPSRRPARVHGVRRDGSLPRADARRGGDAAARAGVLHYVQRGGVAPFARVQVRARLDATRRDATRRDATRRARRGGRARGRPARGARAKRLAEDVARGAICGRGESGARRSRNIVRHRRVLLYKRFSPIAWFQHLIASPFN